MKNIINITVATDFSVTSRNAYRYARGLANSLNATLTMVHVKQSFIVPSEIIVDPLFEDDADLVNEVEKMIAEEDVAVAHIAVKNKVNIKILLGDPEIVLTELSEDGSTDLMIIGTTGLADVLTKIFGSTSIKVSNKARCPVILVPRDVKWKPIEQIMFASNYDSMVPEVVGHIKQFATYMDADMHFVNVKNFDPVLENKQKETNWEELFGPNHYDLNFEKHTVYGNDTIEQLQKYSEEKSIDLVLFVSKHRNFWENIMHKSITENMALSSIIPIMVMHFDDERK